MGERGTALMFVLVLCVCGALLYLDWRRQGELEYLHDRLDSLEGSAQAAMDALQDNAAKGSPVDRILHASDDRTLADIAREGV